jgi:hypothetical protein
MVLSMSEDTGSSLTVRVMKPTDLDQVIGWASAEGWNPGLEDAGCFLATDPSGFLIGCLNDEPIAAISVVRYCDMFGFLGLYIVRPDKRGCGFGHHIWRAGLLLLEGCTVGLDGVVAQQANYVRSGFKPAHRNTRYGGVPQIETPRGQHLTVIKPSLFDAIQAYDRACFPAPREAFLRCWLAPRKRIAIAYVESGQVKGYGVIRACQSGYRIGPLFADGERVAVALFQDLVSRSAAELVFLDAPEPNSAAARLAVAHGLSPVFETARMYRGPKPDLPAERIFGISTLELG